MTAANCPTCDREGCPTLQPTEHIEASRGDCPACVAFDDCYAHRVDWRARALAAEADAARWRKVAPLIANLHRAALIGASHTELIAAVAEVTAATQEPTP